MLEKIIQTILVESSADVFGTTFIEKHKNMKHDQYFKNIDGIFIINKITEIAKINKAAMFEFIIPMIKRNYDSYFITGEIIFVFNLKILKSF